MRNKAILLIVSLFIHALLFAQKDFSKMAFIQSETENKVMFEKEGYKVAKEIKLENQDILIEFTYGEDPFEDSYQLIYSNLGNLYSFTTITLSERKYNAELNSINENKNYKRVIAKDKDSIVYSNGRFEYHFSTDSGFFIKTHYIEIFSLDQ